MNGGYVLLDCGGLILSSEDEQTINGINDRISKAINTGKQILACNCVIAEDAPKINPFTVMAIPGDSVWYLYADIFTITVADDDGVTVSINIAPEDEG